VQRNSQVRNVLRRLLYFFCYSFYLLIPSENKIQAEEPLLSVDDPDITAGEKLEKLRVQHLVKEYLAAQELQVLGETGMSDAIQMYVEKDDVHSIQGYVRALNASHNLTEQLPEQVCFSVVEANVEGRASYRGHR
jgi:hypothetical protein